MRMRKRKLNLPKSFNCCFVKTNRGLFIFGNVEELKLLIDLFRDKQFRENVIAFLDSKNNVYDLNKQYQGNFNPSKRVIKTKKISRA